ncbi:putative transmembrane protein [Leptomonas seymouri]|uniref:Putative transmembrane protein n=1 Tax=Leptomonas seymouri TaxID=5684 RepID=A0A0N0P5G4_LEPSE|nr:putative transmembrane protein [Leptomonas seymouri]|eukprot:KPI86436.1 putative transmembrane protein [Leptomonas seymouri]
MLRHSRLALLIVPSSASTKRPSFLCLTEVHATPAIDCVYRRVMEYDRNSSSTSNGQPSGEPLSSALVTRRYFSGSLMGAVTSVAGVALFVLTFAYNVGRPVMDAHREYFSKLALEDNSSDAQDCAEGDAPNPVEEFDDAVVEEEET